MASHVSTLSYIFLSTFQRTEPYLTYGVIGFVDTLYLLRVML